MHLFHTDTKRTRGWGERDGTRLSDISRQTGYAPASGGPPLHPLAHLSRPFSPVLSPVLLSHCLVLKEIINWVLFSLMDSQLSHKYTYSYHHHSYFLPFLTHLLEDLLSSSSCNTAKLTIQTNPATIHPKTKQITAINFCILATHSSHTRPGASHYSSTFSPLFILL